MSGSALAGLLSFNTQADKIKSVLKLLCAYCGWKIVAYLRWRRRINDAIPGPPDNLFLGASSELYAAGLGDFWGFNPTLFKSLAQRYGKICRFWLPGTGLFVAVSDVELIAELNKQAKLRPTLTESLLPHLGKKNLIFQQDLKMMKELRLRFGKMVQPKETLIAVQKVSVEKLEAATKHWNDGTPVDLFGELGPMLYDIMGKVLFGGEWSTTDRGVKLREVHIYLIEWAARYGMEVLKTPSLANLWRSGSDLRRFLNAIKEFHGYCYDMWQERKQEIQADPKKWENDYTALTMLVKEPKSANDPTPFFTKDLAIATCAGFLNGAYDTTHSTMFWAVYHLAKYQKDQKNCQNEIDRQIGKSTPSSEQLHSLKLLQATIRESLRMRPTVPLGMRTPDEDITVGGYHIPKGTTMLPFLDFLAPDAEKYWGPEPEAFRPQRFMDESPEAKAANQHFDRFGGSARMCIGMTFANAEMYAMLTWILQRYTVHLHDPNMPEPAMIYEAGVYQPKEHFRFVFKLR